MIQGFLIIIGISLCCSLTFSLLRQHRFFAHSYFSRFNLIEYFGYGSKAFLLSLPVFFLGLSILYLIGWAFANASLIGRILIAVIIIAVLTCPLCFHPLAVINRLFPRIQPKLRSGKTYVVFTFDAEEDFDGAGYHNSYKYITSGAFYQLVKGLAERGVAATFYLTPNLCKDMPEVIRYLKDRNQTIGIHLHPHNLIAVSHPYKHPYFETGRDEIADYNFGQKMELMNLAKEQVESVAGHEVLLFRSGRHSCDYELERIAKEIGCEMISNHKGSYFIQPVGIWNLDSGVYDILAQQTDKADDFIRVFRKMSRKEGVITFTGHPMLLYDHTLGKVNEARLEQIFQFVDYLRGQGDVEFIDQRQLLILAKASMRCKSIKE